MGELIDKAKGAVNDAMGKAKQHSENPDTRQEGAAQQAKGKLQKAKGAVEGALGNDI
ncbi:MAG: CsbD family protein [Novosphingobium sp.]